MAQVRKKGESYYITVTAGRDSSGKKKNEYATFVPDPSKTKKQNERDLELFVSDFEYRVRNGMTCDGRKITYRDYIKNTWIPNYADKHLESTSKDRCVTSLDRNILPVIGDKKLSEIKALDIQKVYDRMQEEGYIKNGKQYPYAPRTVKRTHQVISTTLQQAVYWQLIDSNPCRRIRPPKVVKTAEVKHFSLEHVQDFFSFMEKPYTVTFRGRKKKDGSASSEHTEIHAVHEQIKIMMHIALFGGFRRGEMVALKWDDIDFKKCTIEINKTAIRTKEDGQIIKPTPKNYSSIRTVDIPEHVIKMLRAYKKRQREYRLQLGTYWEGDNYVFIQDNGRMMDLSTPNNEFKKIIARYNKDSDKEKKLPDITLHGLRHTCATLMIAGKVDIKTVSGMLGHADTSTTIDLYAHALQEQYKKASSVLDNMVNSEKTS